MSSQNHEGSEHFIHRLDERVGEDGVLEVHPRLGAPLDVTAAYAGVLATLNGEPVRLQHNETIVLDSRPFRRLFSAGPNNEAPRDYIASFLWETLAASGHQDLLESMPDAQRVTAYWTAMQAYTDYHNPHH
jgi:hypothetical protein